MSALPPLPTDDEPDSDECVGRLDGAVTAIFPPYDRRPYWRVLLRFDEYRGFTMKDALNEALAAHEGFDRHAAVSPLRDLRQLPRGTRR